jgi:hypothetical protein
LTTEEGPSGKKKKTESSSEKDRTGVKNSDADKPKKPGRQNSLANDDDSDSGSGEIHKTNVILTILTCNSLLGYVSRILV